MAHRVATAWDLIGFDCSDARVRVLGGRTLYEAVSYNDSRSGRMVRLARLDTSTGGIQQVNRYVEPDTLLEVVPDDD